MAPILSKAAPPPPRNNRERIERAVKKATPLFNSLFEIFKDVSKTGKLCTGQAESVLDSVRIRLDNVCIGMVRILESLCCLDVSRFAKPEKPLTGSLPILFVLMLVVMLYNAFVFGYMPAAGIAINSKASLTFHAWIFLVLASFAQAVRTDPGSTPVGPRWRDRENPPQEATERKRCSDEARWCRKSNAYKPDRAHYCRVLKKGVLRMDHYCPWLGNTVGFHNQKYFFLFLLYTNAACGQLGISFIQFLVEYTLPALTSFCLIGAEGLTLLITSLLVPFFLFHVYLIGRNITTIEFCERMRARGEDKDPADDGPGRYDLGVFHNFCAVLGSNPLLWLLPVGGPPGDGIKFPLNPAYVEFLARAGGATDEEQPAENEDEDEGPEATHPAAAAPAPRPSSERKLQKLQARVAEGAVELGSGAQASTADGAGIGLEEQDVEKGSDDDDKSVSCEASDEENSMKAVSVAADEESFLVWRSGAEFVEDLTIGCQYIGEKSVECSRGSLAFLLTSCVPGARRIAPWGRSTHSVRDFPDGSRRSLRGAPAIKIRTVKPLRTSHTGADSHSDEGNRDTDASASGHQSDRHRHLSFLSD